MRRIGNDLHQFFGYRVLKNHGAAMQINAAVIVGLSMSVFQVAHDGAANFWQLHPDLVGSSCNRLDQKQVFTLQRTDQFIIQVRFFGIFGAVAHLIQGLGDVFLVVF